MPRVFVSTQGYVVVETTRGVDRIEFGAGEGHSRGCDHQQVLSGRNRGEMTGRVLGIGSAHSRGHWATWALSKL